MPFKFSHVHFKFQQSLILFTHDYNFRSISTFALFRLPKIDSNYDESEICTIPWTKFLLSKKPLLTSFKCISWSAGHKVWNIYYLKSSKIGQKVSDMPTQTNLFWALYNQPTSRILTSNNEFNNTLPKLH